MHALTRSPHEASLPASVELITGDLTEAPPEGLFEGVDSVFVFPVAEVVGLVSGRGGWSEASGTALVARRRARART